MVMLNCLFLNRQSRQIADHAMTIILTVTLPQCLVFTEAFGKPTFFGGSLKKNRNSTKKKRKNQMKMLNFLSKKISQLILFMRITGNCNLRQFQRDDRYILFISFPFLALLPVGCSFA